MDSFAAGLACLFALVGCALLYLASPHQRWRESRLPARPARAVAAVLTLASLAAFARAMDAVPAVYAFVTCHMLLFIVLPYLGALRKVR